MLKVDFINATSFYYLSCFNYILKNTIDFYTSPSPNPSAEENIVNSAAHIQYIDDKEVENQNILAHHINALHCQINKYKNQQALEAAQFNGWMAAEILNLPQCTKLVAMGSIVQAIKCEPKLVTFTSRTGSCGPQPIYKEKFTISKTGWELVDFKNCYWTGSWVNFNGIPYAYADGDFKPIEYSTLGNLETLQQDFKFIDDTAFAFSSRLNLAYDMSIIDNANVVADLVAAVSEHHQNTD
jgi:hypothetical protein